MGESSQAHPHRIVAVAKPGRVMWPVIACENIGVKDSYDPRRFMRNNTILMPQPSVIPPAYCFHRSNMADKIENSENRVKVLNATKKRMDHMVHHQKHCLPPGKIAHIPTDMKGSSFFHHLSAAGGSEAINNSKVDQRIANEVGMLQATKPPPLSGGIAAVATAVGAHHRNIGTVQFGMTKMC